MKVINSSVENVGTCILVPRLGDNENFYRLGDNDDEEDLGTGFAYVCK